MRRTVPGRRVPVVYRYTYTWPRIYYEYETIYEVKVALLLQCIVSVTAYSSATGYRLYRYRYNLYNLAWYTSTTSYAYAWYTRYSRH